MPANLNGWHLIILLAVILLLFGAAKLPALAKSLGQSARVFKGEMKAMKKDDQPDAADDAQVVSSTVHETPPTVSPAQNDPVAPDSKP